MWKRLTRHFDLTPGTLLLLGVLWLIFAVFLLYPLLYVFVQAFYVDGKVSLTFIRLMLTDRVLQEAIVNSLNIGAAATLLTSLIALPLAFVMVRCRFWGRGLWEGLLLVPLV
ncbi:MAG TPA: iron ABC transporter permease, partial [Armatimonadetes bacterium]|nr:iron ABC transporter permease [Armatimonadota bacterium]